MAEMRPVVAGESLKSLTDEGVSVSVEDRKDGSPLVGDMIARNPDNHKDMWLVAATYFKANFEAK